MHILRFIFETLVHFKEGDTMQNTKYKQGAGTENLSRKTILYYAYYAKNSAFLKLIVKAGLKLTFPNMGLLVVDMLSSSAELS